MCELSERVTNLLENDLAELEAKILEIGIKDDLKPTVALLTAYMVKRGLTLKRDKSYDKDPRSILSGGTSIRYQRSTKITDNGNWIILYCAKDKIDKENIVSEMGKSVFDNSTDGARPFGIAFKPDEFLQAVSILLRNENNLIK